ncbi:MAG: single-stranded DNA-binding protein [Chloroflexota bacterium]|nr:single-stranded DNA-binding protein [Chloroflexota bacterium]
MAGVSKVILIGNLGGDPETRYTPNGTMNVQFSIAVNRRFTNSTGQEQERTNWFRVTAWGKLAESLDGLTQRGFVGKGKQMYVEGRLDAREYQDQQGVTRTSLDVNATEFQLLGSRGESEGGRGGGEERSQDTSETSFDDVPF